MKKRLLSLLLICCMVLTLMPATAFAATNYTLAVDTFWFDSDHLTYQGTTGTATYSPETTTLTLDNFSITASNNEGSVIYSEIPGLKIVVKGTNTITIPNTLNAMTTAAIALTNANATISGTSASNDKLIINSAGTSVSQPFRDGTTRVGITTYQSGLTVQNVTLQMNDTSAAAYLGHSSLIHSQSDVRIVNSVLQTSKCQHGVFANIGSVTMQNTTLNFNNSSVSGSSGLNFAPDTTNTVTNISGTISAEYPIYTYGTVTLGGNTNKLTLNGSSFGVTVKKDASASRAGSLTFQNANVEMTAPTGIDVEDGGSAVIEGGTVTANVSGKGVNVDGNSTFTLNSGTLNLNGTNESAIGIYTTGTVNVKGGSLNTSSVNCAIQQVGTKDIGFSGGNHTLNASAAGYANNSSGGWNITNGTVTVNAPVGIQLTEGKKGGFAVSGGTLNLNCTNTGINSQSGAGKTALSGGKINITDKNTDSAITGIQAVGELEISGSAEVTFANCKYDILSQNNNNKISGGKVSFTGSSAGLFVTGNFAVTGGETSHEGDGYGILGAEGTVTLGGGTVTLNSAEYAIMAYQNCVIDFAGATVKATATARNAALAIVDAGSSYKITGGEVTLQSTQAGANKLYTSLADGYVVWAGSSEKDAKLISTPSLATFTNNKYVHITKNSAYTLTLENVKEGTSATHFAGEAMTYHANDPVSGTHFSHWELTVGETTTTVGKSTTYTGEMPAGNAKLTAVYENCSGGTATCVKKAVCDTCGKEYGEFGEHDHSADWTSDATNHWKICGNCQEVLDKAEHQFGDWKVVREATTTVKGEKQRTCAICNYVDKEEIPVIDVPQYDIHVTNGTALVNGVEVTKAAEGVTVTLRAATAPDGKVFDYWKVTGKAVLVDIHSAVTTFTMQNGEVTAEAVYKDMEYGIQVTDGKATVNGAEVTKAVKGTEITLTANPPESGKEFYKWEVVSGDITLADEKNATTTFTMPLGNVSVKATYKDAFREQFRLTVGETYWFDLSGVEIPKVWGYLPDTSLRYVPFTYVGSVESYVLNKSSSFVRDASAQAAESVDSNAKYGYKYLHSLFIADSIVSQHLSWDELNAKNLIFGTTYESEGISYTLRAPSAGSSETTSDGLTKGTPTNNEWDSILEKNTDFIKNWGTYAVWGQDTTEYYSSTKRAMRGGKSASFWEDQFKSFLRLVDSYRPVLEVLNADTLGADGLKDVTIELGKGRIDGKDKIHIVVKNGSNFTAPTVEGLAVPSGYNTTGFKWIGSDGYEYEPGAEVPAAVTSLTAVWKDVTEPTGEIKIGEESWTGLQSPVTFDKFFKDSQDVTITAADNSGEAVTIEYLISDKELMTSELSAKTFTAYEGAFSVKTNQEYVVYAKLTDTTGNTCYLSSEGRVLDDTAPVIEGLEADKVYCEAQTVTIIEKYVDTVTVNGNPVSLDENNQFVLRPAEGTQTIVVTDKAGNTAEITVTVNDGHTYEFQSEDGWYWEQCKYCGLETEKKLFVYTVTYAPGEYGTGAQQTADKTHGTDLTLENAIFTREGWEQTGWATIDGGEKVYGLGGIYAGNEAIMLYPVWKDVTEPTGEIRIGEESWTGLQSPVTFDKFFKDSQDVTITAADNSGEAVRIEYLISDKELTTSELDAKTFTAYEGAFTIAPNQEYVVYAKLTDTTGNTCYLSSEGRVLDDTAPVIEGLEADKVYCEAQTVTIIEKYVDTVTVNGNPVSLDENNQFVLRPAEGTQTIVVTDKAGNTAEITVAVNDGHTDEWQTEDGQYWKKCKYCGEETEKKAIPEVEILGADKVCRTQDYTFTFKLPEGCKHPIAGYEFSKVGADLTAKLEKGEYIVTLSAADYIKEENSVKVTVSVETEDGYRFLAEKTVEILDEHVGGTATCTDKAKCEICGAEYGELDANNHVHLKHVEGKKATKKAEGNKEYWYCKECGKYFADAKATKEIKKADTVIAKLKDNSKSAKTGDSNNLALWFVLLGISGCALTSTSVLKKKRKK